MYTYLRSTFQNCIVYVECLQWINYVCPVSLSIYQSIMYIIIKDTAHQCVVFCCMHFATKVAIHHKHEQAGPAGQLAGWQAQQASSRHRASWLSRYYHSITLTDKTPKTGKISTKTCRSIHDTGLPIMLYRLKISANGSLALTQYWEFFYSFGPILLKKTCIYDSNSITNNNPNRWKRIRLR